MRFGILILLLMIPTTISLASNKCLTRRKQIKVAIVDTGLDIHDPRFEGLLCKTGHKNFVENDEPTDFNGHGTHIAGLIAKYAGNSNYCLLIYKYYSDSSLGYLNLRREISALKEAVKNGADIVNFSGGGPVFNEDEYLVIKNNPSTTFVVAAGNEGQDLDIPGNEYYPASYWLKNEIVVKNIDRDGELMVSSNYGKRAKDKEMGDRVESYLPGYKTGFMTGTSQSTAIKTGKLIAKFSKACNYRGTDVNKQ